MTYPYRDTTAPSGWTCGMCGAFVSSGTYHACTARTPVPYTYYSPTPIQYNMADNAILERIASALEKILELLSKEK